MSKSAREVAFTRIAELQILVADLLARLEDAEARLSALEDADPEAERVARERRRYNLTRRCSGESA